MQFSLCWQMFVFAGSRTAVRICSRAYPGCGQAGLRFFIFFILFFLITKGATEMESIDIFSHIQRRLSFSTPHTTVKTATWVSFMQFGEESLC